MPSVHRASRSPYWQASFLDSTGRWRLRSTRARERAAALVVAERWQREADILAGRNGPSAVPAALAPELLERFVTLAQKAQAGELTADDGQAMVNALLVATGQDPLRRETVRAFFEAYLADKIKTRAAATARRYRSMADRFLACLGSRADQPLRTVTANDVRAYRDTEAETGLNRVTVNLGLVFVRSVLEQARREGLVMTNVAEAVANLDAEHAERRAFTLPEVKSMLAVASEDWQTAIHLAIYAGYRLSDATGLRWDQFDADRGVIVHRPKKESRAKQTKKKETVCPTPLADWLRARQKVGAVPITPSLYGRPTNRKLGLSAEFNSLLEAAKIPRVFTGDGTRRIADVGFHALRHTAATLAAEAGVSEDVRREQLGQSSRVHKSYVHRDADAVRKALRNLPRIA
jgi:integrase